MKKKVVIIIGIILIISILGIIFIPKIFVKEEKKEMVNKSYGIYNGIYKYKNNEFRIFHKDDTISYKVFKDGDPMGYDSSIIENNKLKINEYTFEFNKNSLKVKSKIKTIPSGTYKKDSGYSTNQIYKDYIGDVSLYNNKYNGLYENDTYSIYTVQIQDNELRIKYSTDEETVTINLYKIANDIFTIDFFGDLYDITYTKDELVINIKNSDGTKKEISGKYQRKEKLSKEEIINQFFEQ